MIGVLYNKRPAGTFFRTSVHYLNIALGVFCTVIGFSSLLDNATRLHEGHA